MLVFQIIDQELSWQIYIRVAIYILGEEKDNKTETAKVKASDNIIRGTAITNPFSSLALTSQIRSNNLKEANPRLKTLNGVSTISA